MLLGCMWEIKEGFVEEVAFELCLEGCEHSEMGGWEMRWNRKHKKFCFLAVLTAAPQPFCSDR